jgi:hypothetical protein
MKRNVTRPFLVTITLAVLAAVWAGGAAAVSPERTVFFELTYPIFSSVCPDAHFVEHDVGRITFTTFLNADGTLRAFGTHDAAITSTITNTDTGATLTFFYSNFVHEQISVDSATGALTDTLSLNGLNFIIQSPDGPPLVSAGRVVVTLLVTFDADGNPIFTVTGITSTPNIVGLSQFICS